MAPNVTLRKNTADIPWHAFCKIEDPLKLLNECNFAKTFYYWNGKFGQDIGFYLFILFYLIYMCK